MADAQRHAPDPVSPAPAPAPQPPPQPPRPAPTASEAAAPTHAAPAPRWPPPHGRVPVPPGATPRNVPPRRVAQPANAPASPSNARAPRPAEPATDIVGRTAARQESPEPDLPAAPAARALREPPTADAPSREAMDGLRRLAGSPHAFAFFHAARLAECAAPHRPRIGQAKVPQDETVCFGQDRSLTFAPADVARYSQTADGRRAKMVLNCFGLLGPNGPMPLFFSEHVRARCMQGDRVLADFLDTFHHRLASLLYRAWALHQRTVAQDRPLESRWAAQLGSLCGMTEPSVRQRDAVADQGKLFFVGHLAASTRSAEALVAILHEYLAVPVAVEEFVGRWINLPADQQVALGGTGAPPPVLGSCAPLGRRAWVCQQKFRIRLGPMTFARYRELLPDQRGMTRLRDWVRTYAGLELDWDVQLACAADEVPSIELGRVGHLGWSSWVLVRHAGKPRVDRDRDDLVVLRSTADAMAARAASTAAASAAA